MSETITIQVPIQVEHLSDQLLRARPLGPWKIQVVGKAWDEVQKNLLRQLNKALPKTLPTELFAGGLPAECLSWKSAVELSPQDRDSRWVQPLQIELDSFRWLLSSGHCVVRVPAVNCTLFGKPEELDDEEIAKQAQVALMRLAENQGLLALSQRFSSRSYEFRSMTIALPVGGLPEREESERIERKKTATLRAAASDLSKANLAEVHGLDAKVTELAEHFLGHSPQSVLLVGPAGVGKSSLLYRLVALAKSLGLGERKIWSTSGARIVSGMSGLGMWQQRCSKLIRQAHATGAILHLGSLWELLEAGKIDGQPGVASMVRQSIARGKLLAIAECTPEQLAMIEREDPMLLRAFTQMEFKEQSEAKIREILKATAEHDWTGSQVAFSDQSIEELYRLHSRFATYSAMPATALRLMRTIADSAPPGTIVEADAVARAFAQQTGLPRFLVDDSLPLDLQAIAGQLSEQVVGQAEPVELIVNLIATLKARMVRPGRPLASLMFIGPTGVGKTEMAKAIANLLYSDTSRMIRIDMSEYASPWAAVKLIGRPGEGDGTLTSPIREQPFSVVLLDEFEKADSNVFDILLQMLGEGRLTDSQGRLADFRNAVVIMTSNLGAESFRGGGMGFGDGEAANWREHFEREVRSFVRPEFLGRLDRIVPFRPLSRQVVKQIAVRELDKLKQRPGLKYSDTTLEFDDSAVDLLCELGYQPKYGARPLRRAIELNVVVPLANALSHLSSDSTWAFEVSAEEGEITVQPRKRSTKTKSDKEVETSVINAWQQLGIMSRTARTSSPVRDLDNELERTQRHTETLEKRLIEAQGPSRIAALRLQVQQGQAFLEISRKIRSRLFDVTQRISSQQLSLMTAWYRGTRIDWEHWHLLGKTELTQLRQAIEDVLRRRVTSKDTICVVVTGKGELQLDALWKAYGLLAQENGWSLEGYLLQEHDSRSDESSLEMRQAISTRRGDAEAVVNEPQRIRLRATPESGEVSAEILADAYRFEGDQQISGGLPSLCGFAMQFQGPGVESWLEEEAGIVHFYDTATSGFKRRLRFRVIVSPGSLADIALPLDWLQPASATDRDPRRVVDVVSQFVSNETGVITSYSQGKLAEGMVVNMQKEHERALWQSIGYAGIPTEATLSYFDPDEIPY